MFAQWLEHLLTPCPRPWRELGYLREQIATDAREQRHRTAWAEHLANSRSFIKQALGRCTGTRCALVLGGGLHHDLPLPELAGRFRRVWLADLLHRPKARRAAAAIGSQIGCLEFDVSGALRALLATGGRADDARCEDLVRGSVITLPGECGGEPDLVVSANLASQLMLRPGEWLARHRHRHDGFQAKLAAIAMRRHLDWLAERRGIRVLITDLARIVRDRDGTIVLREELLDAPTLRPPDRSWTWRVAPIPDYDPDHHLDHLVGAWIDG